MYIRKFAYTSDDVENKFCTKDLPECWCAKKQCSYIAERSRRSFLRRCSLRFRLS